MMLAEVMIGKGLRPTRSNQIYEERYGTDIRSGSAHTGFVRGAGVFNGPRACRKSSFLPWRECRKPAMKHRPAN